MPVVAGATFQGRLAPALSASAALRGGLMMMVMAVLTQMAPSFADSMKARRTELRKQAERTAASDFPFVSISNVSCPYPREESM